MTRCDPYGLLNRTVSDTFRIDEFVAEGGYGVVYRGFHEHFRAPIALKVLKVPAGIPEEVRRQFWEEFRREAEVQFRLSALTRYVVRPFHVGQVHVGGEHALPMMALEWLEGMDLEAEGRLRQEAGLGGRALPELLELLSGAAKAIHLSHNFEREGGRYSVVHRDIKPENLFLAKVGERDIVKILDFGTSKVGRMIDTLAGDPAHTARPGHFSPAYAAPEQWVPDSLGQTGAWTDVWGMALTLVELMKGRHVFEGNMQRAMFLCLNERERPTPRAHGVEVSDAVEGVFQRALAVDPRDRIQSVRELWLGLRAAIAQTGEEIPASFGAREVAGPGPRGDSELPFVLSDANEVRPPRRRAAHPPRTGTFPIASRFDETKTPTARTGTDAERLDTVSSDTLRELDLDWDR